MRSVAFRELDELTLLPFAFVTPTNAVLTPPALF